MSKLVKILAGTLPQELPQNPYGIKFTFDGGKAKVRIYKEKDSTTINPKIYEKVLSEILLSPKYSEQHFMLKHKKQGNVKFKGDDYDALAAYEENWVKMAIRLNKANITFKLVSQHELFKNYLDIERFKLKWSNELELMGL